MNRCDDTETAAVCHVIEARRDEYRAWLVAALTDAVP